MKEHAELGQVPNCEDCQQVGNADYSERKAKQECNAFLDQLIRVFGRPPKGGFYEIRTFFHAFGSYKGVCLHYEVPEPGDTEEESSSPSFDYFLKVDRELPEYWDEKAKQELGLRSAVRV